MPPIAQTEQTGGSTNPLAWGLSILLGLSLTINFVDRLVLSTIAPTLFTELHFTSRDYSYIVFAFMLGMTLGQVPAGIFIDWIGARIGLASIFAGWSISSMAQSLARTVANFSGLRFLMGLFECGNYSAGVKTIGEISPPDKRALALGIFDSGSLVGSVIAPTLVVYIAAHFGWQHAFFLPSLAGLLWIPLWLKSSRSAKQLRVPRQDNVENSNFSVSRLLRLRQTWGVISMRALAGPLSQFYWYWLPLYFVRGRGLKMETMASLASLSYLVGGFGQLGAGYISGFLIRLGWGVDRARKVTFSIGAILAGLCTLLAPMVAGSLDAALVVGLGIFGVNAMANHVIAVITDVFPEQTLARVTGLTGVGEGIVNMSLTLLAGVIIDRFSWFPVFATASLLPLGSLAGLFLLVRKCQIVTLAE